MLLMPANATPTKGNEKEGFGMLPLPGKADLQEKE